MQAMQLNSRRIKGGVALLVVTSALLQGCATTAADGSPVSSKDPYESWNRKVFSFNDSVDRNVMQPVARGYNYVVPDPVKTGVRNVFNNIGDIWSTINLFLQGRFADGTLGIIRVTVNTTFGLAGLIDVATPMQLDRPNEDFGQTLGVWGAGPGPYIVWPFLGSSTLRDSFSIPGDYYFSPSTLVDSPRTANQLTALRYVSVRANLLSASGLLDDVALDKYAFYRDAYLQRRQSLIDNDRPQSDDDDDSDDSSGAYAPYEAEAASTPEAAASGASAPAAATSSSSAPSAPAPAPAASSAP